MGSCLLQFLGHTYPIFTGFRGGKGVATAMGGLLGFMPACLLVGLFVWLLTFYLTKYVAVASIAFRISLPVCSLSFFCDEQGFGQTILAFVVMGWIIWRHRSNLARLRAGTESRFEKKRINPQIRKMNIETSPSSSPASRLGILGFGTVGQGTWKHLLENAAFWPKILGVNCSRFVHRSRTLERKCVDISPEQLTTDSAGIVDDPEIDLICELIGGWKKQEELTLRAFALGKSVVTANKALICEHGEELFQAAEKAGVTYGFEASVAGGYPLSKFFGKAWSPMNFPDLWNSQRYFQLHPYPDGKRRSQF